VSELLGHIVRRVTALLHLGVASSTDPVIPCSPHPVITEPLLAEGRRAKL